MSDEKEKLELSYGEKVKAAFDTGKAHVEELSDKLITVNETGAPALTMEGMAANMIAAGERGASLVALISQLNGPRVNPLSTIQTKRGMRNRHRTTTSNNATNQETLQKLIEKALAEGSQLGKEAYENQVDDLFVILMHILDVIDGRGERQLFIWMFMSLYSLRPATALALLPLVPEYGCWRTLRSLYLQITVNTTMNEKDKQPVLHHIVELWINQLEKDMTILLEYQTIKAAKTLTMSNSNAGSSSSSSSSTTTTTTVLSSTIDETMDIEEEIVPKVIEGKNKNKKLRKIIRRKGPSLSLAGKWAPSPGGSIDKQCDLGTLIANGLNTRLSDAQISQIFGTKGSSTGNASNVAAASTSFSSSSSSSSSSASSSTTSTTTLSSTTATVRDSKAPEDKSTKGKKGKDKSNGKRSIDPVEKVAKRVKPVTRAAKLYRKSLSALRESLGVLERKMANNQWNTIEPTAIPSLSNKKYNAVLLNKIGSGKVHPRKKGDPKRGGLDLSTLSKGHGADTRRSDDINRRLLSQAVRTAAIESIAINNKESSADKKSKQKTIKGARNQVHELIEQTIELIDKEEEKKAKKSSVKVEGKRYDDDSDLPILGSATVPVVPRNGDILIEAMWSDLVRTMKDKGNFGRIVPMVDVSGSMDGTPLLAAVALGILASSVNAKDSPWYGKLLTFSTNPSWFDVTDNLPSEKSGSLYDTVKQILSMPWGGRTHFGKALRLLLDVMTTVNLPRELAPSTLLCLTDMQFNAADGSSEGYYGEPLHAQLCIVMDCTGSMGTWIEASKACVIEAAEQIRLCLPTGSTFECAYICYRDHCDGNSRIVEFPFTPDMDLLRQNIQNVQASGGGDFPEDVAGGFQAALNLPWKKDVGVKLVIHVADAPAHGSRYTEVGGDSYPDGDPNHLEPYDQVKQFAQEGIDFTFFRIGRETDKMTDELRKGFNEGAYLPGGYGADAFFSIENIEPYMDRTSYRNTSKKASKYLADTMVSSVVRSVSSVGRRLAKHLQSETTVTNASSSSSVSTFVPGIEPKESTVLANQPFTFAGEDVMEAFDKAGYPRPTVVFWNLRTQDSDNLSFQADASLPGIAMVSGFSQETLRQFCEEGVDTTLKEIKNQKPKVSTSSSSSSATADETKDEEEVEEGEKRGGIEMEEETNPKGTKTPWERLYDTINGERYSQVRTLLEQIRAASTANMDTKE